jgi:hypothetical protein
MVRTGEWISFALIRRAVAEGTTKVELMRTIGLSRYSLNQCLKEKAGGC